MMKHASVSQRSNVQEAIDNPPVSAPEWQEGSASLGYAHAEFEFPTVPNFFKASPEPEITHMFIVVS